MLPKRTEELAAKITGKDKGKKEEKLKQRKVK